jgi:3-dehydroquinate synthase
MGGGFACLPCPNVAVQISSSDQVSPMRQSVIPVTLPEQSYNIAIVPDGLDQLGNWLIVQSGGANLGRQVLLVSNNAIFKLYGDRAVAALSKVGFTVAVHLIPAGEKHKTPASIQKIYDSALKHRLERSSTMVALGGGVVGDMTGFAAATWLRGINFVQVPTSLLAMVDASIGGKTGVNHPKGKNLIGAFYQPKLVFIDPSVLQSLPRREFRAGMAEVIKYGVIGSPGFFEQLEAAEKLSDVQSIAPELLESIVVRSCQAKADVVSQDEKEAGIRAILNYGHTIGHAVESLGNYEDLNHGEAVAVGMVAAGRIAAAMGLWERDNCDRQEQLITKAGLPVTLPVVDHGGIVTALLSDKKVKAGKVRFVLPTAIGSVVIRDDVEEQVLRSVLADLGESLT